MGYLIRDPRIRFWVRQWGQWRLTIALIEALLTLAACALVAMQWAVTR